jgi:hypothetical protein
VAHSRALLAPQQGCTHRRLGARMSPCAIGHWRAVEAQPVSKTKYGVVVRIHDSHSRGQDSFPVTEGSFLPFLQP